MILSQEFAQLDFNLPKQFTPASLQNFVDCRRRFLLKHIYNLPWPALQGEPALELERRARLGSQFHKLAHQFFLGIPAANLEATIQAEKLYGWWENFQTMALSSQLTGERIPEVNLSAPIGNTRLVGKIDLLLKHPDGKFSIYDWKTSLQPATRRWLAERLQTRIYPYLLVKAGASLNAGAAIMPQQVEMVYWWAEIGHAQESFKYSKKQFEADHAYLTRLVETITRLQPEQFSLTEQVERCAFCQYRSYCERGLHAGLINEPGEQADMEDPFDLAGFDFESVSEIEY